MMCRVVKKLTFFWNLKIWIGSEWKHDMKSGWECILLSVTLNQENSLQKFGYNNFSNHVFFQHFRIELKLRSFQILNTYVSKRHLLCTLSLYLFLSLSVFKLSIRETFIPTQVCKFYGYRCNIYTCLFVLSFFQEIS